jgi:hypothetical protein
MSPNKIQIFVRVKKDGNLPYDYFQRIRIFEPDGNVIWGDGTAEDLYDEAPTCFYWFSPCWLKPTYKTLKQKIKAMKRYDKRWGFNTEWVGEL